MILVVGSNRPIGREENCRMVKGVLAWVVMAATEKIRALSLFWISNSSLFCWAIVRAPNTTEISQQWNFSIRFFYELFYAHFTMLLHRIVPSLYFFFFLFLHTGWTAGQKRTKVGTSIAGSEIEMAPDFECPEEFGYYPDPNDCTRYRNASRLTLSLI